MNMSVVDIHDISYQYSCKVPTNIQVLLLLGAFTYTYPKYISK